MQPKLENHPIAPDKAEITIEKKKENKCPLGYITSQILATCTPVPSYTNS